MIPEPSKVHLLPAIPEGGDVISDLILQDLEPEQRVRLHIATAMIQSTGFPPDNAAIERVTRCVMSGDTDDLLVK